MLKQHKEYCLNCRQRIQDLEKCINELRIKDVKLMMKPQTKSSQSDATDLDPIQDVVEALRNADVDYFSPQVIDFFEEHLGFELTNSNKDQLEEHLEKFFSKREEKFIQSHAYNRIKFLRNRIA